MSKLRSGILLVVILFITGQASLIAHQFQHHSWNSDSTCIICLHMPSHDAALPAAAFSISAFLQAGWIVTTEYLQLALKITRYYSSRAPPQISR
jgi:hypothetical protein